MHANIFKFLYVCFKFKNQPHFKIWLHCTLILVVNCYDAYDIRTHKKESTTKKYMYRALHLQRLWR